jgi:4-alpha-glucanotransferase
MNYRSSGILLHLTSLPAEFGIGDMGPEAYRFADFLAEAKQHFWQILPLTPTSQDNHNSPYHSISAFAGNPLLISPVAMVKDGLVEESDLADRPHFLTDRVDFAQVGEFKNRLFDSAYERFKRKTAPNDFRRFCARNQDWLDDYALFSALRKYYDGRQWNQWPAEICARTSDALKAVRNKLKDRIEKQKFLQYVFNQQWHRLKSYCNQKEIQIIGDIPIYLPCDSADVWAHTDLFKLDQDWQPTVVSGVPPDYFSRTGQLWGHPVYRWDVLQKGGYHWWIRRLQRNIELCDIVRIDHFRGLVAYWEVPAQEKTAVNGRWISAPVDDFFHRLQRRFACLPIIAEDLGIITSDVREIMQRYQLPGMRVLLFAFGEDFPNGAFLPHQHVKNCVVYTGTHDNNTVRGWFMTEATPLERANLFRYLGREVPARQLSWELIRLAMMSVADTAIIPMQDILGLGAEARMNQPARLEGNWHWRMPPNSLSTELSGRLLEMAETCGRV